MSTWAPPADIPRILVDPPPPCPEGLDRHGWGVQIASRTLSAAVDYFRPVQVFACLSGGYDSLVATMLVMQRISGAKVLHINTGIGIEATRQYVRDLCERAVWPLVEQTTTESYEDFVLEHGFPGPAMHGRMYQRLKERPLRAAMKAAKEGHPRTSNVLFVSGIRWDESTKRTGYQRCVSKVDSQVWVNPFYWSGGDTFREYRLWLGAPKNPVKERLGMSGECLCGAYAYPGELDQVEAVCPETAAYIRDLERRVRANGHDWGWEDPGPPKERRRKGQCPDHVREAFPDSEIYIPDEADFRPMCHNCDKVQMVRMGEHPTIGINVQESTPSVWSTSAFLENLRRRLQ